MFLEPRSYDIILQGKMVTGTNEILFGYTIGVSGKLSWHYKDELLLLLREQRQENPDSRLWAKYSYGAIDGYMMEVIPDDMPERTIEVLRVMNDRGDQRHGPTYYPQHIIIGTPFFGTGTYQLEWNKWMSYNKSDTAMSREDIERELVKAIEEENYERAAELRDEIDKKTKSSTTND